MYLSIVFITLSKEVSLESIFQVHVALLSHIFKPLQRGGKYKFSIQKKYGTILLQFQTARALEENISAFEAVGDEYSWDSLWCLALLQ